MGWDGGHSWITQGTVETLAFNLGETGAMEGFKQRRTVT